MQKLTQKYAIIQLLEKMDEGDEFDSSDWPLHVTIADTFAVNWENINLVQKLSELLAAKKPITATAGSDEYFGQQQQTQVSVLDANQDLTTLHCDVVALLKSAGAVFNDPQYIEAGYRAHAAVRLSARLVRGQAVTIDTLTVIDMFPAGDPYRRKVMRSFGLLAK